MNWYVEHRAASLRMHRPVFRPLSEQWTLGADLRSVYAYPDQIVEQARKDGSLQGLERPYLRADWLFIDVDSGALNVSKVARQLQDMDLVHERWSMGTTKRAHFHLPLATPIQSPHVIYSQVKWLRDTFGAQAPIDWSIYTVTGQIRMPGTVNSKRWAVKTLDYREGSVFLEIPVVCQPPRPPKERDDSARVYYTRLLTQTEDGRGRHRHLWRVCRAAVDAHIPLDKVLENVVQWNERWASSPLQADELRSHTQRTYRSMS